jgi:hypothetical protein
MNVGLFLCQFKFPHAIFLLKNLHILKLQNCMLVDDSLNPKLTSHSKKPEVRYFCVLLSNCLTICLTLIFFVFAAVSNNSSVISGNVCLHTTDKDDYCVIMHSFYKISVLQY